MKTYTLDTKRFLLQANWGHEDFAKVAKFLTSSEWDVSEDILKEKISK